VFEELLQILRQRLLTIRVERLEGLQRRTVVGAEVFDKVPAEGYRNM
jgi:hypothetical protein